jgi:hypothetical protein
MSFSEDDCTSSLGWPPCVQRTSDLDILAYLKEGDSYGTKQGQAAV